jgi:hypothetical protein
MEKPSIYNFSANPWDERRQAEYERHRALVEQCQKNQRLLMEKEAAAKKLVGRWTLEIWRRIACGDYPAEVAAYNEKRIAVIERACIISIDARLGHRPGDPESWSKEALEARVDELKARRAREQKRAEELHAEVLRAERNGSIPTAKSPRPYVYVRFIDRER